ncbi:G-protein coupled receptor Mth-like isoform X1 [Drosophila albomicans]|uniref:G-protein coupled receptor Mth-like isoform X1 n=2 Tax=Drosophila albomicans TaxID=7291 RepID=A0A6P8X3T6_DROAB|nr:G-protein coupled receptor Mth-like isoform X1 [Drosophila albomicans]
MPQYTRFSAKVTKNPKLVIPARSKTMHKYKGLVLIVLLINSIKADIPGCDYFDTVKLLPTQKLANGSYKYENIIIPPEQTGEYDYEILQEGDREEVEKHLRGCACHLGTCIRFCCQKNALLVEDERKCSEDITEELQYDPMVNITLNNGTVVRRHVLNEFIVQHDLPVPCSAHFHLDALNEANEGWTLFENGTLLRHYGLVSLSKQDYCLQPHPIWNPLTNETILSLVPHNCYDKQPSQLIYNLLRFLSIIFLVITIIVYLYFDKLRNLQGLCFVNYMICISVAFAGLLLDKHVSSLSLIICQLNGYLGYFAVMAGFNWLTIISYDLWASSKVNNYNVQRNDLRLKFCKYNKYAWGVAALLTLIIMILDGVLSTEDNRYLAVLPGVALYNCWVKVDDWSAMIYYFGIITLQLIFNLIMFTLTAIRLVQLKKELRCQTLPEDRVKHVYLNKQTFGMFARLFVLMGIVWFFEIFSYLSTDHPSNAFFSLFDYVNCAQGIIIFILFVLKRSVLNLIWNRCRGIQSTNDEDASEEGIALQDRNGDSKKIGPNILT